MKKKKITIFADTTEASQGFAVCLSKETITAVKSIAAAKGFAPGKI